METQVHIKTEKLSRRPRKKHLVNTKNENSLTQSDEGVMKCSEGYSRISFILTKNEK
jgi:hypothetical protein